MGGGGEDIDELITNRKTVTITKTFSQNWSTVARYIYLSDIQAIDPDARYIIGIRSMKITGSATYSLYGSMCTVQPTLITISGAGGGSTATNWTWTTQVDYI